MHIEEEERKKERRRRKKSVLTIVRETPRTKMEFDLLGTSLNFGEDYIYVDKFNQK